MDKEIRKVDDVRDDITKIDYEIAVRIEDETVWLTQAQIAELFEKRMGFAAELALSKKQAGESIYNKNKEEIENYKKKEEEYNSKSFFYRLTHKF